MVHHKIAAERQKLGSYPRRDRPNGAQGDCSVPLSHPPESPATYSLACRSHRLEGEGRHGIMAQGGSKAVRVRHLSQTVCNLVLGPFAEVYLAGPKGKQGLPEASSNGS